MKMSVWSISCQQSVFQRCYSEKHLREFYPQDGGKSQLASKLRHCHSVNSEFCNILKTHAVILHQNRSIIICALRNMYSRVQIVVFFNQIKDCNWMLHMWFQSSAVKCVSFVLKSLLQFATGYFPKGLCFYWRTVYITVSVITTALVGKIAHYNRSCPSAVRLLVFTLTIRPPDLWPRFFAYNMGYDCS